MSNIKLRKKRNRSRPPVIRCGVCGKGTKCGKSYCKDHIENEPYVRELLKTLAKKEREVRDMEKAILMGRRTRAPKDSILFEEIEGLLEIRDQSLRQISRSLQVDATVVKIFVDSLRNRKVVSYYKSKKTLMVKLISNPMGFDNA
jgi:hypothetical protein